ncbi:DUF2799 domain-containing protein [Allopusillimonas ginsengisoli]|nr:DUF2799 domain-containing protein [Allopusillimonas ginsengisoli]
MIHTTCSRLLIMLAIVSGMAGCASMSEKDCLTANWQDQGYRDGRDGLPLSRIEDHREACWKVGVVPDARQYQAGRAVGIREYCTPDRALYEGRQGRPYRNACPANLERQFLQYHQAGRRIYDAEQHVDSLNSQSRQLQNQLDKEKNASRRKQLRRELRDLDYRLQRARDDVRRQSSFVPARAM